MIDFSQIRNFEIPANLPKFDLSDVDWSAVEQPVVRVAGAVRDVAYATAGLAVLATEKVTDTVSGVVTQTVSTVAEKTRRR